MQFRSRRYGHFCSSSYPIFCFLVTAPSLTFSMSPPTQYAFSNPPSGQSSSFHIPTVHESAILARRIFNLSSIATVATVFPSNDDKDKNDESDSQMFPRIAPPHGIGGAPIGLMEYYAACPPYSYTPTILAISIATAFRNSRAGSNVSLSLRWHPPSTSSSDSDTGSDKDNDDEDDPYLYSPANLPRFSLEGYIEAIPPNEVARHNLSECFFARHSDARLWRPGNDIHESWWARLVVKGVYWFGGFGDRAYIGWIPVEEWEGVTDEEIRAARLVGEEGWRKGSWKGISGSSGVDVEEL